MIAEKKPATLSDGVVDWLINGTRDERFIDKIFADMCVRLQQAGIPLARSTLHVLIQHPQWLGARFMWSDGMSEAEIARVDYDVRERSEFIGSPASEMLDGATEVRENLERDNGLSLGSRNFELGLADFRRFRDEDIEKQVIADGVDANV